MNFMEILLLIIGAVIFVLSFLIPSKDDKAAGVSSEAIEEEIAKLVKQEMDEIRGHVDDVVDEALTYALEKAERSLERLTNEKIMAVNEYSDTVLEEIHRNHEEAMFLYDMLNNKHTNLKNTVSEINKTVKEAEETVSEIQRVIPEAPKETVASNGKASESAAAKPVSEATSSPEKKPAAKRSPGRPKKKPEEKVIKPFLPTVEVISDVGASVAGRVSFLEETDQDGRNNNERILALYKQGKSKVAIAKELGLGVGEVKLVIDLFQNQ